MPVELPPIIIFGLASLAGLALVRRIYESAQSDTAAALVLSRSRVG